MALLLVRRRQLLVTRPPWIVSKMACALLILLFAAVTFGSVTFGSVAFAAVPVDAESPDDDNTRDLDHGRRLFEGHCARCHGMQGAGGAGANLARPMLRHAADDEAVSTIIKEGIPGTAMPGNWFLADREIENVMRYVRSLGHAAQEPLPGDPGQGKGLFAKHDCGKCHIVAGQGGGVGPDLTDIGARRGLDFLRKAVMHPGTDMPLNEAGYGAYLVVVAVSNDGRVVTGMRINEDTFTIQIRDEKNRIHSLNKRDLDAFRKTGGSMMPSYEKELPPRDVDHLISYLAGLRGTKP